MRVIYMCVYIGTLTLYYTEINTTLYINVNKIIFLKKIMNILPSLPSKSTEFIGGQK